MKRVLVRSSGHFVLLTVLQQGGFLEAEGLDPKFELCDMADDADGMLLAGEIDLISGSHHTPYLHYDDGKPMVILASTTNQVQETFISREPIKDLSEMRDKRLALSPLLAPGVRPKEPAEGHPRANIQIMLERAGIADTVEYLGYGPGEDAPSRGRFQAVADGFADGAFGGYDVSGARALGLHSITLDPLPMISGVTLTTTWTKLEEYASSQDYERFARALYRAVHFFKTEREATIDILKRNAEALNLRDEEQAARRYERTAAELVPSLVPTAAAIHNAFHIAEFERPGVEQRVNPLELWDLHFARAAAAAVRAGK